MDGIVLNVYTINYNARIYCRKKLVFRHLSLHTAPHFMMRLLILKCVCVYMCDLGTGHSCETQNHFCEWRLTPTHEHEMTNDTKHRC